jgi:hypothetical protein
MDMIPGTVTYYWFTPTRAGTFDVLCAELCGTGHTFMRGNVVVEPEGDHQAWLQQQKTFAQLQVPTSAQAKNQGWIRGRPRNRDFASRGAGDGPMVDVLHGAPEPQAAAEVADVELYHPHSWMDEVRLLAGRQGHRDPVFDGGAGDRLVALVLSWLMRLQLGFPGSFSFIDARSLLQFITMHGMIMVIYLLTALFLGGFGNYLIPLMVGARDMVFPYVNMLSYWIYLLAVLVLVAASSPPAARPGRAGRSIRRRRSSPARPARNGASS